MKTLHKRTLFSAGIAVCLATGWVLMGVRQSAPAQAEEGHTPQRVRVLVEFARKNPGDPHVGKSAFKSFCAGCHKMPGQGGAVGPDLACVSTRLTPEALIRQILQPPQGSLMPSDFANHLDGPKFSGLLAWLRSQCPKGDDKNGR